MSQQPPYEFTPPPASVSRDARTRMRLGVILLGVAALPVIGIGLGVASLVLRPEYPAAGDCLADLDTPLGDKETVDCEDARADWRVRYSGSSDHPCREYENGKPVFEMTRSWSVSRSLCVEPT